MKRLFASAVVFAFVLMISAPVFALPEQVEKFKGGLVTVIKSPLEIKDNTIKELKDSHYNPFGLVGGVLKGSAYMVKKSIEGVRDMATFMIK